MFTVSKTLPIQKELLSEVGFEPTPPCGDHKPQQLRRRWRLESGVLDHSAILTFQCKDVKDLHWSDGKINNRVYNVYGLKNASNSKRACVRSGIWSHASMRRSETSTTEKEITPWVWRYGRMAILTFQHKDVKDLHWSDGKINNREYNVYGLKNASNSKTACVRSGIWTHASMWRPEPSTTEKEITPWVWRLRPLGHSDLLTQGY